MYLYVLFRILCGKTSSNGSVAQALQQWTVTHITVYKMHDDGLNNRTMYHSNISININSWKQKLWLTDIPHTSHISLQQICDCFNKQNSACCLLFYCLAYSSALRMEVIFSSKTLAFFQTTRCYNPGNHTLPRHHCKNLICNKGNNDCEVKWSEVKFSLCLIS
jgi:hypothetical protein